MEDLVNQTVESEAAAEEVQEENTEDPFKRLTDDIIVSHIFDKIVEAKSLCFISLVSKHLSSLVYKSHVVFLKIPYEINTTTTDQEEPTPTNHPCLSLPGKFFLFVTTPLRFVRGLFCSLLQRTSREATSKEDGFLYQITNKFLVKFTSLRSLYVELDCLGTKEEAVIKWMIHSKSSAFIFFIAPSLDDLTLDGDGDGDNVADFSAEEFKWLTSNFDFHLEIAELMFLVLEKWVPNLPESLQNIVLTDSKRLGKVVVVEDGLVKMRNGDKCFGNLERRFRLRRAPSLKLPLSGYVMNMVSLVVYKDKQSDYDDFLMAKEAFNGEEENVFAEAAMELLNKEVILDLIV